MEIKDIPSVLNEPIVSVIIPVYNAENSLYIALESLERQVYQRLEIIIVNDYSTDDTLNVARRFISILEDKGMVIRVVNHEYNQGVAAARNMGLEHATGEFIYYVDADDYIEPDAIGLLVKLATSQHADIVGCNWFLTFETNERKMNQPSFESPDEAIERIFNGTMRWNLWLFLVRRSLYDNHQIRFIPGMNMGEDLMVMVKLFINASRVVYLNKPLYHYGQSNEQSLTKVYSDKHIKEVTRNVEEVEQCLLASRFSSHSGISLDFLKLNIKLPLLISDQEEQYQRWLSWFPESNEKVMQNKALPSRTRLLQWFAFKKQFWVIKLYYHVIIRFVYGRLYK